MEFQCLLWSAHPPGNRGSEHASTFQNHSTSQYNERGWRGAATGMMNFPLGCAIAVLFSKHLFLPLTSNLSRHFYCTHSCGIWAPWLGIFQLNIFPSENVDLSKTKFFLKNSNLNTVKYLLCDRIVMTSLLTSLQSGTEERNERVWRVFFPQSLLWEGVSGGSTNTGTQLVLRLFYGWQHYFIVTSLFPGHLPYRRGNAVVFILNWLSHL